MQTENLVKLDMLILHLVVLCVLLIQGAGHGQAKSKTTYKTNVKKQHVQRSAALFNLRGTPGAEPREGVGGRLVFLFFVLVLVVQYIPVEHLHALGPEAQADCFLP